MFQRLITLFLFLVAGNSYALSANQCQKFFENGRNSLSVLIEDKGSFKVVKMDESIAKGTLKVSVERNSQNKIQLIELKHKVVLTGSATSLKLNELLREIVKIQDFSKDVKVHLEQNIELSGYGEFNGIEISNENLSEKTQFNLVINQYVNTIKNRQNFTSVLTNGNENLPANYKIVVGGEIKTIEKGGKYDRQKCE